MSEPESKLDMTALNDALETTNAGGTNDDPTQAKGEAEQARETMNKSNTLKDGSAAGKEHAGSPQTMSPSGSPPTVAAVTRSTSTTKTTAAHANVHPTVQQIKAMFPDMDIDTIQAVVTAEDGDFERAINTLLQMSDPTYVPPPPRASTQMANDEELARSLAANEEEQLRSTRRRFIPPSSARGGALGSIFGMGGGGQAQEPTTPSYDPSNLTYQPRVRRTPSSGQSGYTAATTGTGETYADSQAAYGTGSGVGGLPGPREAKQWQEDINKMAEQGFAKAASTFSALRQKGEQAWAARQQQQAGNASNDTQGTATGGGVGQKASSFFNSWNQRTNAGASNSTTSPTLGSGRGFDRDPSPVGENELAKILARGRADKVEGGGPNRTNGLGNIADRYKNVVNAKRQGSTRQGSKEETNAGLDDDDNLGWDDAGRTGDASKKTFAPIQINDNSSSNNVTPIKATSAPRNAVSLMESSTGRGLTTSHEGTTASTNTGKGQTALTDSQADDDDDDLEYVANPFEDED